MTQVCLREDVSLKGKLNFFHLLLHLRCLIMSLMDNSELYNSSVFTFLILYIFQL